jgi:hypothetical protein
VIYFVDMNREPRGLYGYDLEMTIHTLNTQNGLHKPLHYKNYSHMDDFARILFSLVESNIPQQIIFDKAAYGMVLYDLFLKYIDRSNIGMMPNGMLFYK